MRAGVRKKAGRSKATSSGFNPAELRPGFNGALDFNMKASGAPFGGDGKLDFAFSNLSGKLRGNSASGSGRVMLQGEDWTFEALRFRAGNTSLAIDGDIGASRALNLDFSLDADNLALVGRRRAWRAARARQDRRHVGRTGHQAERPGKRHRDTA